MARAIGQPNSSNVTATAVEGVLCVARVTKVGNARSNKGRANSRPRGTTVDGVTRDGSDDDEDDEVGAIETGSKAATGAVDTDDEDEEREEDTETRASGGSTFTSCTRTSSPRGGDNDASVRGRRNTGRGDDDVDGRGKAVRGGDVRGPAAADRFT
jgi:hypothetical protein